MFHKSNKTKQQESKESKSKQANFAVYLLPDNKDETFVHAHELAAKQTQGCNAVLLFPDPSTPSNRSGSQKYKARFIQNGGWVSDEENNIKEATIGIRNFNKAKLMVPNSIDNHENIIKAAYARAGLKLPPILALPNDLLTDIIQPSLEKKSQASLANTSFLANQVFQPELQKAKVKKLLEYVIHGEQAKAESLLKESSKKLKTFPELFRYLFETKMIVTDYSGRKIEGTAFQLALGAEDVGIQKNEECMAEMLARYIKMLPNGEEMLAKQYQEQFPAGWEAKAAAEAKHDAEALYTIIDVVKNISEGECQIVHDLDDRIQQLIRDPESNEHDSELKKMVHAVLHTEEKEFESKFAEFQKYIEEKRLIDRDEAFNFDALKAIYQFRNFMESKTKEVIKNGKHFNTELLLEAFKLYDTNYDVFGGARDDKYNSAKNILCWRKVIGYVQRFVPSCLAQAIHQGLYYMVEDREKLQRLPGFRFDKTFKIFPLDSDSTSFLGFDYADGPARLAVAPLGLGLDVWGLGPGWAGALLQNLCRTKTSALQSLCNILEVNRRAFPR